MDFMIYLGLIIFLFGIAIVYLIIDKKGWINGEQIRDLQLITDALDFVVKQFNFKYKSHMIDVIHYCKEALEFIESYSNAEKFEVKKLLVAEKAVSLCKENGIEVNVETMEFVDRIIDFLYEKYSKV